MTVDFTADDPAPDADTSFAPQASTPPTNDNGVVLEVDGRKYTKDDLVKKITNSDKHIKTLEQERAEDRKAQKELLELLEKSSRLEDVLTAINANKAPPSADRVDSPNPDELARQVIERVTAAQNAARASEEAKKNWDTVTTTLTKLYGKDKVQDRVKEVAAENGLSLEEAAALAKKNPNVFLKLFPETSRPRTNSGTLNTAAPVNRARNEQRTTPSRSEALRSWRDSKDTNARIASYKAALAAKMQELGIAD